MSDRALFGPGDLGASLDQHQRDAEAFVENLAPEQILGRATDELVAEISEEFEVEPLAIHWDRRTLVPTEVDLPIQGRDRVIRRKGMRLTFVVPFDGEPKLFGMRSDRWTTLPPTGSVQPGELRITIEGVDLDADRAKAQLDRNSATIDEYVGHTNRMVRDYNARLPASIAASVERRRSKVQADHDLIDALGVPLHRVEMPEGLAVPLVPRRLRPQTQASMLPGDAPHRVLLPSDYEAILSTAENMLTVIERSPRAFKGMREEDIRTHFLVQLNARYAGQATGETFNFEGKTDILIRADGKNVFIAECKFWNGPKQLMSTVDQLLSYTTWRDTKTAIFILNRRKEMSAVLAQISPTIRHHPSFVRELPQSSESRFRFVLRHRDDPGREITVTVLVFEVPL